MSNQNIQPESIESRIRKGLLGLPRCMQIVLRSILVAPICAIVLACDSTTPPPPKNEPIIINGESKLPGNTGTGTDGWTVQGSSNP